MCETKDLLEDAQSSLDPADCTRCFWSSESPVEIDGGREASPGSDRLRPSMARVREALGHRAKVVRLKARGIIGTKRESGRRRNSSNRQRWLWQGGNQCHNRPEAADIPPEGGRCFPYGNRLVNHQ